MRRILLLLAAVLVCGVLAQPNPVSAGLNAGDMATDFHKTDLGGNQQTLFQYRGQVVVLFVLGYS